MATALPSVAHAGQARRWRWPSPGIVLGLVCAAVFAMPFAYLVVSGLADAERTWEVMTSASARASLWRTVQLGVLVTVAATVLGTAMAWVTVRTDVPGRRAWRLAAVLPLVIPSFVGANAFVAAFAPGGLILELLGPFGINSLPDPRGLPAAFVVLTALTFPYVFLPVAARLSGLPPSLEESARLLGRSPSSVLRTVVLPQCWLAIGAGALLVLLYVVSDFGAVQFVGYDTLTRQIYAARFDRVAATAFSLILASLALAVTLGERAVARRMPAGAAVSVRRTRTSTLGGWRWLALAFVVVVVVLTLVGPVAVLLWWVWQGIVNDAPTSGAGSLLEPVLSTAVVSVVAALVTVTVVLPIARLTVWRRSASAGVASGLVVAGFALPGLVVALALVDLFIDTPLYGGFAVLITAYLVHFGGQAMRSSQVALGTVSPRLDEAARLLGASRLRRLATVEIPIMLPGLAAGAGLVMLNVMKELPATLLLSPLGYESLATRIWQTAEQAYLFESAAASLVLIALSALLGWFFVIRRLEVLDR